MISAPGSVAVVTGGNTGIGAATSRRLAADGASVAIGYFDAEAAALALRDELQLLGGDVLVAPLDVRRRDSVAAFFNQVRAELGLVHLLVNCAGIGEHRDFLDIEPEHWQAMFETHVAGSFWCGQAAVVDMVQIGAGAIVNVTSELALIGEPRLAHYVSAKAAVIGLTKSLAREVGRLGIRVNAVAPGPTDTAMLTDEERTAEYIGRLPLRRLGRPEDIAGTIAFLCSDDAAWMTGQIVSPNGGAVI